MEVALAIGSFAIFLGLDFCAIDVITLQVDRLGQLIQIVISHDLDGIQHLLLAHISVLDATIRSLEMIVLCIAQRPSFIQVVPTLLLVSFDDLVLLHLVDSFSLIAPSLTQYSSIVMVGVKRSIQIACIVIVTATHCILILAVALNTLQVEVTSIETIGQVVYIIEHVALSAT